MSYLYKYQHPLSQIHDVSMYMYKSYHLIPRLYCHFIKFKWSNFMFGTCLCVVPFLWQQQTTQLPKLNSHNEACLSICLSLQPELSRGWWTTSTPCLFQHCSLNTDWIAGLVTSVTKSSKIWLEKLSYCIVYLFLLILWLIIKFWCWLYWLWCRVEWFGR